MLTKRSRRFHGCHRDRELAPGPRGGRARLYARPDQGGCRGPRGVGSLNCSRRPQRKVLCLGKGKAAYCPGRGTRLRARPGLQVRLPRRQRSARDTHPGGRWSRGPPPCSADGAGTGKPSCICGPRRRRPGPVTSWRGKGPHSDTACCLRAAAATNWLHRPDASEHRRLRRLGRLQRTRKW